MTDRPAQRVLTVQCSGPDNIRSVQQATWTHGHVHLHFATLDHLRGSIPRFTDLLDADEQERMQRFRQDPDRDRFIIAHGWLRTLLAPALDMAPEEIRFQRGPYGKPYLADHRSFFNLSDTKDAVLLAITDRIEIGADVETMTRRVDHAAVSAHYFTPAETRDIGSSTDPKRRFLELWTRKEAVLKASGVGIMDDLHVLQVNEAVNTCRIAHPAFVEHAADAYNVRTWHVGPDHIVSVATAGRATTGTL